MDQPNPPGAQGGSKQKQPSRMSPPSSPGGEGDSNLPDSGSPGAGEQTRPGTPPVPLLRPAQGAWDKAYAFGKPSQPLPPQAKISPPPRDPSAKSSPAAHTRSKDRETTKRREPSAPSYPVHSQDQGAPSSSSSRITHPESAQRHSQASTPAYPSTSTPSREHEPPRLSPEHYRQGGYAHPTSSARGQTSPPLPPPQYPHRKVNTQTPHHEHPRGAPAYASSSYYSSPGSSAYTHPSSSHYPQSAYVGTKSDPYVTRSQNSVGYTSGTTYPLQDDPLPVVVLLMEDTRCAGPDPDFQLAEVSVSLRPQVGEDQGWWADGEEVMKALQLTPSRLEGSAKVFARRGKYRQCFVRFSEDGVMECQPSSLMVSRDKTIELIIEPNLESRASSSSSRDTYRPHSPQHDAYARTYAAPVAAAGPSRVSYDHDYGPYAQQSPHGYASSQYYLPSQNPNGKRHSGEMSSAPVVEEHPAAKRAKTTLQEAVSLQAKRRPVPPRNPAPPHSRPGTSSGHGGAGVSSVGQPPTHATPTTRMSSPEEAVQDPISPYGPFQRHESLPIAVKAPKEVVNAAIVAYLRSHIQTEDGYIEFAASKGRLLPIPDLLKGYRFATRIVNTWANRKTPPTVEGCPNKRITKNHVLQALFRQTSWGSDCEQTLQLADKYGPGGPREDPRVVEILSGGSMLPEKSGDRTQGRSQGSVALLDFLKDVDREHKAKLEEELRKSSSSAGKDSNESARGELD